MTSQKPSIDATTAAQWYEIYLQQNRSLRRCAPIIGKSHEWIGRQLRLHGYTLDRNEAVKNKKFHLTLELENDWACTHPDKQQLNAYLNDCLRRFKTEIA